MSRGTSVFGDFHPKRDFQEATAFLPFPHDFPPTEYLHPVGSCFLAVLVFSLLAAGSAAHVEMNLAHLSALIRALYIGIAKRPSWLIRTRWVAMSFQQRETERVAALDAYGMLDTPRERDFDEIAELASEICETPIAVVNLIGDKRQFFKAEVGLGVRETPLDSSFCAKAILEEDFLLVPDATKDSRFDRNPLVAGEPNLRFYAGALLKTDGGHAIGTLCVLDYKPRSLSPLQEKALRVLSRQVMRQLELRRLLREREAARARQDFLAKEISHRMKNTLAMVQAIANQTFRNVEERDAVEAFQRRISALDLAHDQLLQENWAAAPLRRVVRLLLDLHDDAGRINADGPELELGPRATLSISLLLNELATNAAKHGALSMPGGHVNLSWQIENDASEPILTMIWKESGGPPVTEPIRRSFGSRLIRLGLVGKGDAEKLYLPGGLVATFRGTLRDIREL